MVQAPPGSVPDVVSKAATRPPPATVQEPAVVPLVRHQGPGSQALAAQAAQAQEPREALRLHMAAVRAALSEARQVQAFARVASAFPELAPWLPKSCSRVSNRSMTSLNAASFARFSQN